MTIDELIGALERVKKETVLGGRTRLKFHSDELEAVSPNGDGELLYDEPVVEVDRDSEPEHVLVYFTDRR